MKKKLVSVLLSAAMTATLLAGCGGAADTAADTGAAEATEEAGAEEAAADEVEEAVEEETPTATFGDSSGTHLEMWRVVRQRELCAGRLLGELVRSMSPRDAQCGGWLREIPS